MKNREALVSYLNKTRDYDYDEVGDIKKAMNSRKYRKFMHQEYKSANQIKNLCEQILYL